MQITKEECKNLINREAKKYSPMEVMQLTEYLYIYKTKEFSEHWQVNNFISRKNLWGDFNLLHSLNTHASGYQVDGIWPRFFGVICRALMIRSSGGSELLKAESPDEDILENFDEIPI